MSCSHVVTEHPTGSNGMKYGNKITKWSFFPYGLYNIFALERYPWHRDLKCGWFPCSKRHGNLDLKRVNVLRRGQWGQKLIAWPTCRPWPENCQQVEVRHQEKLCSGALRSGCPGSCSFTESSEGRAESWSKGGRRRLQPGRRAGRADGSRGALVPQTSLRSSEKPPWVNAKKGPTVQL